MPMTPEPIQPQTPLQRLILEQALLFAQQLESTAQQASHGRILDACETVTMGDGRTFLRNALAATLHHQAQQAEKKGRPPAPAPVADDATTKEPTPATS